MAKILTPEMLNPVSVNGKPQGLAEDIWPGDFLWIHEDHFGPALEKLLVNEEQQKQRGICLYEALKSLSFEKKYAFDIIIQAALELEKHKSLWEQHHELKQDLLQISSLECEGPEQNLLEMSPNNSTMQELSTAICEHRK